MRNNHQLSRGFTLIEVLVATVILSLTIITLSSSFKHFSDYQFRRSYYENLYASVLSLQDMISERELSSLTSLEGTLNGIPFNGRVAEVDRQRNLFFSEFDESEYRSGIFEIILYRIELSLGDREYSFYQTRYKQLVDDVYRSQ